MLRCFSLFVSGFCCDRRAGCGDFRNGVFFYLNIFSLYLPEFSILFSTTIWTGFIRKFALLIGNIMWLIFSRVIKYCEIHLIGTRTLVASCLARACFKLRIFSVYLKYVRNIMSFSIRVYCITDWVSTFLFLSSLQFCELWLTFLLPYLTFFCCWNYKLLHYLSLINPLLGRCNF